MTIELDFGPLSMMQSRRHLKSLDLTVRAISDNEWCVKNESNGHVYSVLRMVDGYSCGCKDWKNRRITCKHMMSVMNLCGDSDA